MPLWNVYCTEGTYSAEDKRAFAEAITDIYASEAGGLPEMAMPRFYVVVVFHDVPKDSLFIGPCRYEILKIERSEGRGERPPQLINIDYYAPELKLVIAKEYKERDGRLTLIKFDRIYPIKR